MGIFTGSMVVRDATGDVADFINGTFTNCSFGKCSYGLQNSFQVLYIHYFKNGSV